MNCGVSRGYCFLPVLVAHHRFGKRQTSQLKAIFQSNFWCLLQDLGALGQFILKVSIVQYEFILMALLSRTAESVAETGKRHGKISPNL